MFLKILCIFFEILGIFSNCQSMLLCIIDIVSKSEVLNGIYAKDLFIIQITLYKYEVPFYFWILLGN